MKLSDAKAICEAATRGTWASRHSLDYSIVEAGFVIICGDVKSEDADFIATFNPAKVAKLLALWEAADKVKNWDSVYTPEGEKGFVALKKIIADLENMTKDTEGFEAWRKEYTKNDPASACWITQDVQAAWLENERQDAEVIAIQKQTIKVQQKRIDELEGRLGTSACPLCGKDEPHFHTETPQASLGLQQGLFAQRALLLQEVNDLKNKLVTVFAKVQKLEA